jgi:hypothetical protein
MGHRMEAAFGETVDETGYNNVGLCRPRKSSPEDDRSDRRKAGRKVVLTRCLYSKKPAEVALRFVGAHTNSISSVGYPQGSQLIFAPKAASTASPYIFPYLLSASMRCFLFRMEQWIAKSTPAKRTTSNTCHWTSASWNASIVSLPSQHETSPLLKFNVQQEAEAYHKQRDDALVKLANGELKEAAAMSSFVGVGKFARRGD